MNKTRLQIILISTVIIIGGVLIYFLFNRATFNANVDTLPEPNIKIQTQTVKGIKFNLRNAKFTDKELMVGYEVVGGSLTKNDLVCIFYNDGKLIEDSTGGEQYKLGEMHYYLTARI
ncbi:hypothetical protein [Paenibacillus caui]|uniref:hypothetical protein n=1 Tax=Paenibacillus caui TaxID=2873927 RepID=UPI001CA96A6C|nr:hypothetical protein [Paenibacillus caui]